MMFNPKNWFWKDAAGLIFSSAALAIVSPSDSGLAEFTAAGNAPTPGPRDDAGAQTPAALDAVLAPHGLKTGLGSINPADVKAECSRRIFAVASANCQMNMTAAAVVSDADKAALAASLAWVLAMRGACVALIGLGDKTFADDAHWPACPADVAAFAARF
jgi:hypothetical protein